ncbi:MAG: site-2 protease family protein, partial [bacterium]|nr:site-2 protease family protein [bacterium]
MILTIIIAFVTLLFLIVLHELGHFVLAKKFGVRVEEFGLGLPPRIWGKRFMGTLYSLNFLPLGAFVRLYGEEKEEPGPESFFGKPIWQRALIVGGGAMSFWIVAAIALILLMGLGAPVPISDTVSDSSLKNPRVQIAGVAPESPAQTAGLRAGDIIKELRAGNDTLEITKVSEVQELMEGHRGEEVAITLIRGKQTIEVAVVPRFSPPEGEGPLGVAL